MQAQTHKKLPRSFFPYIKAVLSRKPLLALADSPNLDLQVIAQQVHIDAQHVQRYCDACGIAMGESLPPAYLHVLAMPLHMRVFTHPQFPVKVLGLVHLRNVIRQQQPIPINGTVQLSVRYNTLREMENGQEYDLVTTASMAGQTVWEEVSTMMARRHVTGKRPVIERAVRNETRLLCEQNVEATKNIGRRYARASGDYNPIHLFDRTAQWFSFKQMLAHGMWSLSHCIGMAQSYLPAYPYELDGQFKLPIYLPSNFVFRAQRSDRGVDLTLSTIKGDRMHLSVQAKPL